MKIIEDEGFCTACGRYAEYKYGQDNFSLIKKDLNNYKKYKDLFVFRCRTCGFISTDITAEEGVLCGHIKDSFEYSQILEYAYLNELDKDLDEQISTDNPASLYEAYSLICLQNKDYEKLIRTLNRSIEFKLIMERTYRHLGAEVSKEEENEEDFKALKGLILDSIKANREQIDYYYQFVENKNVFLKLLYIENKIALGEKATALKEFLDVCRKTKLEDDLETYFNNLLKAE